MIGEGLGSKQTCQANKKDLLTGEQILFTELQNFAAFKSYRILNLGKLVIKKHNKIKFLDVLRIFELLLHLESNLAEIWNIASTHKGKKSGAFFFEKYCQLLILCQFYTKNCKKNTKIRHC